MWLNMCTKLSDHSDLGGSHIGQYTIVRLATSYVLIPPGYVSLLVHMMQLSSIAGLVHREGHDCTLQLCAQRRSDGVLALCSSSTHASWIHRNPPYHPPKSHVRVREM